jgi:Fic family protein
MAAKASSPKSSRKEPVAPRRESASKRKLAVAPPTPPPPIQLPLEERVRILEERLEKVAKTDPEFRQAYRESLDMSWIYHDSALEGTVYTGQELRGAVDPQAALTADSSIQPICEEIRRHRESLDFIRDYAVNKKRQPITVDVIKKIYLILHPEEGDIKTVKYRKDIPQHRLYFHEYAPPDKITYKVRQIIDWVNDPETRRTRSPVRIAARAHYDLLRVFPFPTDSGKVARLFMNLLLLRAGFPPAIVHSTERQRYYEALKGSSATMTQIVHESIENNLGSVEKMLDAQESKGYSVKV